MDIGLDDNNDLSLDHRNDIPVVTGREAFEQALRLRVTDYFYNIVGNGSPQVIESLIRVQAQRVANDMESVDFLQQVFIEESPDRPNTMDVSVVYSTGEDFSFSVSE